MNGIDLDISTSFSELGFSVSSNLNLEFHISSIAKQTLQTLILLSITALKNLIHISQIRHFLEICSNISLSIPEFLPSPPRQYPFQRHSPFFYHGHCSKNFEHSSPFRDPYVFSIVRVMGLSLTFFTKKTLKR